MIRGPKKSVTVLLPMDLYTQLKQLARETGWPLSRYIRQILRRYLRRLETYPDDPDNWWLVK